MRTLLLLPEKPISVLPTLATKIGLNEAIALQQLHYWLVEANGGTKYGERKDDKVWVYNNYEQWKEKNFPFWSISTIRRTFASLERQNLVITRIEKNSQFTGGRRKWYTVNYETVNRIGCVQIEQTVCPEWTDPSVQNEQTIYNESETTTENTSIAQPPDGAAQTPPEKSRKRKPAKVKTLADLDQLRRVIAINAHHIKPGEGITANAMVRINMVAKELAERFGQEQYSVSPEELAASYAWHVAQDGHPAAPKDPVKTCDMVAKRREAIGSSVKANVNARHFPHPVKGCSTCGGTGAVIDSHGTYGPCPTCLAAEEADNEAAA